MTPEAVRRVRRTAPQDPPPPPHSGGLLQRGVRGGPSGPPAAQGRAAGKTQGEKQKNEADRIDTMQEPVQKLSRIVSRESAKLCEQGSEDHRHASMTTDETEGPGPPRIPGPPAKEVWALGGGVQERAACGTRRNHQ
jgi:hypothetical protein